MINTSVFYKHPDTKKKIIIIIAYYLKIILRNLFTLVFGMVIESQDFFFIGDSVLLPRISFAILQKN